MGRMEGVWTGGIACANAHWSACALDTLGAVRTRELPGHRVKLLLRMLARRVLAALKARLRLRLILLALGAWEGGVGRRLGEVAPLSLGAGEGEGPPRLGGWERLICRDRGSASAGLHPPPAGHWRQFC